MSLRPGLLAALLSSASLTLAPAALAGPDLTTTVNASPNPVAAGQYVTLTITADNIGDADAHDVVVKSFVPAGTQFVHATSGCTLSGSTVKCPVGTLVPTGNVVREVVLRLTNFSFAGVIQNFVTAHQSTTDADPANDGAHANIKVYNHSHDHHLTVSRAEQHISLPAMSGIKTFKLECPNPGDIMTDGSVRTDNVDQGTGTLRSLSVLESYAEGDGYRFTVVNYATGQAQGKLFGTCISKTTQAANTDDDDVSHTHDVQVGAPKAVTVNVTGGQRHDVKVSCDAGPGDFVAVAAPGFDVFGAEGHLVSSLPDYDANGRPAWKFGFVATQSGQVTFSIRCLNRWLTTVEGHSHELWLSRPDKHVTVEPNAPAAGTYDIDCSDEAKGIVAGYDLPDPLFMAGHDPQPKRRSFKILNEGGVAKDAHLLLLCIGDRTGTDPPPPVGPSAVASTATVSATGASVGLTVSCPAGGCGGSVDLLAAAAGSRATAAAAKAIGRATFRSDSRGRLRVKVTIAKRYRAAVRSGTIRSATAVIRRHDGRVAERQKVVLKRG